MVSSNSIELGLVALSSTTFIGVLALNGMAGAVAIGVVAAVGYFLVQK